MDKALRLQFFNFQNLLNKNLSIIKDVTNCTDQDIIGVSRGTGMERDEIKTEEMRWYEMI